MLASTASSGQVRGAELQRPEVRRSNGRRLGPSGPLLFARYAYGPNRLGLCGPEDADALFGEATSGGDEREVRHLARGFEGAFPYLQLIASANGVADPLDRRVVEGYWLGGRAADAVTQAMLDESLRTRFRPRLGARTYGELRSTVPGGAKPIHAFHVLDVFPRVGLMRSGQVDRVLETMDRCRIRWGRVVERSGDDLIVSAVSLTMTDGRLVLGPAKVERVSAFRDGWGFIPGVGPGDVVSLHWDWACDVLDDPSLRRLVASTKRQLEIANQTI